MNGTTILTEVIGILTGGISSIGQAIGTGLSSLATSIFLQGTGDTQTLSVFAIIVLVFAGVSLSISLCRLIVRWISTLGGSDV